MTTAGKGHQAGQRHTQNDFEASLKNQEVKGHDASEGTYGIMSGSEG